MVLSILSMKVHPEYKCNKLQNDVALLEMETDVSWVDADPACFPPKNANLTFSADFSGMNGIAAGWGATNEDLSKG